MITEPSHLDSQYGHCGTLINDRRQRQPTPSHTCCSPTFFNVATVKATMTNFLRSDTPFALSNQLLSSAPSLKPRNRKAKISFPSMRKPLVLTPSCACHQQGTHTATPEFEFRQGQVTAGADSDLTDAELPQIRSLELMLESTHEFCRPASSSITGNQWVTSHRECKPKRC